MTRTMIPLVAIALTLAACTSYEYEEEVFLEVDGSGRLRVSGSTEILAALHDAADGGVSAMRSRFDGSGLAIDSVRETERQGRKFVHVQGTFSSWNELCAHPAYRHRECRLEQDADGELELHLNLPSPGRSIPEGIPPDAVVALRFHFPSTVRFHNSSSGIERGNIIGWERPVIEHFESTALAVVARFERRSVLATTAAVLGAAVAVVLLSVASMLIWMVRKGRRQLAEEMEAERSPVTQSPAAQ
jgi:hypothetical protein